MAAKFEIFKDSANEFRFHLKAANGEVVAQSEGYTSKQSAQVGIEAVRTAAADAVVEDLT